jgi:type I restriction enzyme S subunit
MSLGVSETTVTYQVDASNNAVPQDYKQTDVGIIPNDWLCTDIGALNPFVTSGSRGWAAFYSEYGQPFVRITNTKRHSIYLDLSDLKFVNLPETSSEGKRTSLLNGDVLISITADIGISSYVDDSLAKPAYINQHIALVRFDLDEINSKFVTYFLSSENVQKLFRSTSDQGAKAGLNLDSVKKIKLALPSQTEQTAIANALSDVDALIQELEKLIAKKQAIKTATMQQLLTGRTRLPQFAHHPDGRKKGYKPSELGDIPEDWELMPLGELTELIRNGSNYKTISKDGVPVSRIETIAKGFIDFDRTGIASEESIHASYKLRGGDILYSHINSVDHIGKVALYESDRPLYHGINLLLIRVDQNTSSNWLYSYLSFSPSREWAKKIAKQAVSQASINTKELKQLVISTPAFDEQEAIGLALKEFDLELELCKFRLDKTRQIKQGMMQELLTGKTRLVKPAEPA